MAAYVATPESEMIGYTLDFLRIGDDGGMTFDQWLVGARLYGEKGKKKMLVNPGAGAAGIADEAKALLDHIIGLRLQLKWKVGNSRGASAVTASLIT